MHMGDSKQAISRAEAHELVDTRIQSAIREVTWLIAVVVPELMKSPQWTPADRQKLAAALHGVAESQRADGRISAATAAAALAEALDAQAKPATA
jgi:hypothetical protein